MFPAYKPAENLCFFSGFPKILCGLWFYADNFFLPFNLLAAKTFLPPFVLILALNP